MSSAIDLAMLCRLMGEAVPSPAPAAQRKRSASRVAEDPLQPEQDSSIRRMLHRIGLLSNARPTPETIQRTGKIIDGMTAAGVAREEVAARLRAYSQRGGSVAVCLTKTRCADCYLKEHCRHARKPPTIKQLPEEDRPRERLLKHGGDVLSDAELLGILIGSGRGGESAIDLARRLLARYGSLHDLSRRSPTELCQVSGIGPAKAAQIGAGLALARRLASASLAPGDKFTQSRQVFEHYHQRLRNLQQEAFCCLMLDTKNKFIRDKEVSRGGLESSPVNPRDVFTDAVRETASAVIFIHNHPSGDPAPSRDDIALTRRLKEAGELLGLRVLDHIIIGKDQYYSFADEGRI
jgi:DNA repair protein RadC